MRATTVMLKNRISAYSSDFILELSSEQLAPVDSFMVFPKCSLCFCAGVKSFRGKKKRLWARLEVLNTSVRTEEAELIASVTL